MQAGIPRTADFNGAQKEGAGYYQTTTNNARRWSAAAAYLRPARNRQNLTVITEAHATRVLIENGRAVGVEYRTPQGLRTARARGEVIVSGGTYGSPHLLQLSGLGPADLLNELGITVGPRNAWRRRQPARPLQHLQRLSSVAARHAERPRPQHAAQARSPACSMRSAGAA